MSQSSVTLSTCAGKRQWLSLRRAMQGFSAGHRREGSAKAGGAIGQKHAKPSGNEMVTRLVPEADDAAIVHRRVCPTSKRTRDFRSVDENCDSNADDGCDVNPPPSLHRLCVRNFSAACHGTNTLCEPARLELEELGKQTRGLCKHGKTS